MNVRDETVEVGAPLYEIDTDATASVEATSSSSSSSSKATESAPSPAEDAPKAAKQPAAAASTTSSPAAPHRTPSIQFLGKDGWAARLRATQQVVELPPIHPMYGRPTFSEEEMEALMLGGAEQAPKIVTLSSGATFTY